ncbi:MAG: hypothetical protein IJH70_02460 [Oscillospiraceae bacterium]|nr:hypothetical protein [Oscillospiraceae bacterium]
MSEEFKPINTQEELNQVISQRLEQARSAERAKFADYDSIKTQLAGLQKDVTAKDTTIADLQGQLKTSRSDLVKTRIALEKGIPQELCSRLVGETEEEIRADADKLAGLMTKPKTAPPLKDTENESKGDSKDAALRSLLSDIRGS